jgi:Flp pilus assembly pilin Flp
MKDESGMTLIEVLIAALMSVILVGASCAMLINAVSNQPALSGKAKAATTARYQLERIVRELRNGVMVEVPSSAEVRLRARVRRVSCGGAFQTDPLAEPVQCRVTYRCDSSSCTRIEETLAGSPVGTPTVALSGIGNPNVFCYVPSAETDPTQCGAAKEGAAPTFVGVSLQVPDPKGPGFMTISDGATLRTSTFSSS